MPGFGPLVSADWLAANLATAGVRVADVRWYLDGRSGHDAYRAGHIPGAAFVDLDEALAGPAGPSGRHPLPTPETFAAAMAAAGIGDTTRVVAYDDSGGSTAARLWWMLTVTGHATAVLDGGMAAWTGNLVPGDADVEPAHFTPRPWPSAEMVDADAIARDAGGGVLLLDARTPERFRGEVEPIDPRPGHIPSARNAPWPANLDPVTTRFLPPEVLRARYTDLGAGSHAVPMAYCGSGVTACHNLLALEVAGLHGRLYPGSWSEWASDPNRPAEVGDE